MLTLELRAEDNGQPTEAHITGGEGNRTPVDLTEPDRSANRPGTTGGCGVNPSATHRVENA